MSPTPSSISFDATFHCYEIFDRAGEDVHMRYRIEISKTSGGIAARLDSAGFSANDKAYLNHIGADEKTWIERCWRAAADNFEAEMSLDAANMAKFEECMDLFGCAEDDIRMAIRALLP